MVDTESLASDATAVNVSDRPVEVAQQEEFRRLGTTVYADYAGAGLYSERQLAEVFQVANSHATETRWNTGAGMLSYLSAVGSNSTDKLIEFLPIAAVLLVKIACCYEFQL